VKRAIPIAALLLVSVVVAAVLLLTMHDKTTKPISVNRPATIAAPIAGAGFSTSSPLGWSVVTHPAPHKSSQHLLSSTGASVNGLGLGPAGTIAVTIDDTPAAGIIRGRKVSQAGLKATRLLALNVGTPKAARGVSLGARPRPVALDGVEAGEESYLYSYEGRQNMQVDVIASHGGRVLLIELDAEPRLASSSQAALTQILANWHWR
jgi:hypothetical protein